MSHAAALFRLQTIDTELETHRVRLAAIEAALSDSPAVRTAQRSLLEAQSQLDAARISARTLEQDLQALNEHRAEVEERLYSGRVTNPKELQDLQRDVEMLKRQCAGAEEQQLDALIKAETAEARLQAADNELRQAEAQAAKTNTALTEERGRLKARAAQLTNEREAVITPISADDRELYERLRQSKKGRAVSRLEDGVCTACGVAPAAVRAQSVRQGSELVRCGNCDRILYAD